MPPITKLETKQPKPKYNVGDIIKIQFHIEGRIYEALVLARIYVQAQEMWRYNVLNQRVDEDKIIK